MSVGGRRLEDHLPPPMVEALKAIERESGISVREQVLIAVALDLSQRAALMRDPERMRQATELVQGVMGIGGYGRREGDQ